MGLGLGLGFGLGLGLGLTLTKARPFMPPAFGVLVNSHLGRNQGDSDVGQMALRRPLSQRQIALQAAPELRPASTNQRLAARLAGHTGLVLSTWAHTRARRSERMPRTRQARSRPGDRSRRAPGLGFGFGLGLGLGSRPGDRSLHAPSRRRWCRWGPSCPCCTACPPPSPSRGYGSARCSPVCACSSSTAPLACRGWWPGRPPQRSRP